MPSAWSLIDTSFPTFTGDEKIRDQISVILNYMFMLAEGLKYQTSNLGAQNFNATALKNIQIETTADVEAALEELVEDLLSIKNNVSSLRTSVSQLEDWRDDAAQQLQDLSEGQNNLAETQRSMQGSLTALQSVVQKNNDGSSVIGAAGKRLDLIGSIYINGKLVE